MKKDKTHRRQCKISSFKKLDLQRDFEAGVYLSEAQIRKPPLLTQCIRVYVQYTYSHRERGEAGGGGGGGERVEP